MKKGNHLTRAVRRLLAVCGLASVATSASAGTFANITIDGDFTDWAPVPVSLTDPNESLPKDISQIFLANNATNLFIRVTFNSAINPNSLGGFYLAFDNDSNASTGFNIFTLGLVGSEGAYQNDFPFEQATGTFNTFAPNLNATIAISPYNVSTSSQEFSISRAAIIDTGNAQPLFPNDSFNFGAYFADSGVEDFAGPASYTFAIPEPSTYGMAGVSALGLLVALRRRRAS